MTEGDYYYNKSTRDVAYGDRQHEAIMNDLIQRQEYGLIALLKPKITKLGSRWRVLYGEDLDGGIAGFGDTPYLAILDFNKAFNTK